MILLADFAGYFACYASSTSANIFAITESWLSERDVAHKTEITLPG